MIVACRRCTQLFDDATPALAPAICPLHRRFASARHRGEWFRPVAELLAFIKETTRGEA